jgi:iron complex outermembrane recepter protein
MASLNLQSFKRPASLRRSLFLGAVVLMLPQAGWAQESQESNEEAATNSDIIVSARRRDERLQDVPVSVSVLSGAQLESAQVSSVRDLNAIAPSLVALGSGSGSNATILAIRGIGNNNATSTPRVGMIIDDVPIATQLSVNGSGIFDVDQVEVLRGPQTSLYGLNAEGGLIVIKTRKPGDKVEGRVSLGLTDDGEYRASLSASGPVIAEKLSIGFGVQYEQKDGFIFDPVINRNIDQSKRISGRIRMVFTPSETTEFDLIYSKHHSDADFGVAYIPLERELYNTTFGVNVPRFGVAADAAGFADANADEASFKMSFDLGAADLISVTAYRRFKQNPAFDPDQTPDPFLPFFGGVTLGQNIVDQSAFTQELRLASKGDGSFVWTAGLFYFQRKDNQKLNIGLANGIFVPFRSEDTTKSKSISAFAQGTYKISGGFSFTLGGRYERVREKGVSVGILNGFSNPVLRDDPIFSSYKDDFVSFRAEADYKPTDDILLYASVARSWLPGGGSLDNPDPTISTYAAEKSWNYEVGAKTQLLDRRLTLNMAAYLTDISDYQELIRDTPISGYVSNAKKVRAKGFEVELNAHILPSLTITGGIGYNDIRYRNFTDAEGNKTGNRVPIIPKYSASASITWEPIDDISLTGGWQSAGTFYEQNDALNALGLLSGYSVFNASVGYDDGRYSVQAYVNNIGNNRYITYANTLGSDEFFFGTPGQPRQFGLTLGYKF